MGRKKQYDDGGLERSSKWAFCAYPDSAPEQWVNLLKITHVAIAISPLHDADVNGDDTEKKPHWHVMLDFDTLKSYHQVEKIANMVNGCFPIVVQNPTGYYRYLTHKDNPEKAQYDWHDIQHLSGFNYDKYVGYTKAEKIAIFNEITDTIDKRRIFEYSDLIKFYKDPKNDRVEYVELLYHNTVFFNAYISSVRNKHKDMMKIQEKQDELQRKIEDREFQEWKKSKK